jgi:hypothetical protein
MVIPILLAAFALQQPAVDTAAVYAGVLEVVRAEHPELPVVLARTRSGVACMPLCGAGLRAPDQPPEPERDSIVATEHSSALIGRLMERGLVDAACDVAPRTFGCRGFREHLFVALGEVQESPVEGPRRVEGGVWMKVALLAPCGERCPKPGSDEPYFPDGYGLWYLLKPGDDGAWRVAQRMPAFFL